MIDRSLHRVGARAGRFPLVLAVVVVLGAGFLVAGPGVSSAVAASDVDLFANSVRPKQYSTSKKATELGVRFSAARSGQVVALQFYRGPKQKIAYTGSLWSAKGVRLAKVTFPKSSKTGWQTVKLSKPVAIKAKTVYVASYFDSNGRFGAIRNGFKKALSRNGLTVQKGGGVSKVTKKSAFPKTSYKYSNYLIDVVFRPTTAITPASPVTPPASPVTSPPPSTTCPAGEISAPNGCVPAPPVTAAPGKSWKLTFNDDFNNQALDGSKWSTCFDWNYGACADSPNQGRERYLSSQVRVAGGLARLVAEPLSPAVSSGGCYQGRCDYKSGMISTARLRADDGSAYRYSFTYGYVESRLKLSSKKGFFSAFWMLPNNPSFNYDTELDIAEVLGGDPDTIFMTYHYKGRSQSFTPNKGDHNNGACKVKDYTKDFVRLGVDWQPDHIAWYIDGVKCGQFSGNTTTIEDGPMHLMLETMVDNQWQRDWNLKSTAGASDEMQIDYVRVYQQR